jgi:hypothetical protein
MNELKPKEDSMTEVITHYAHRSGYTAGQRCPRLGFWQYFYQGIGVERFRLDVPLARGIYVHRGLERLLLGQSIDDSIKFALDEFDREIASRGLEVASLEDSSYVYKEQRALIEAMLYGWWKKRFPVLLDQYDILEVEREEEWDLGEFDTQYGKCRLVWLGKADALLKEKDSGDLFIQSFKTTADWDSRKDSAAMHDVQGLSELCAVEHRLAGWWEGVQPNAQLEQHCDDLVHRHLATCSEPPKIMGIRMEHLLAGNRIAYKKTDGQKVQYSPLIRGYKKDGITPELDELAWKFTWSDEFGEHRLGKGWRALNMWEQEGGVRAWIDKLADQQVQAELGDCLEQQVIAPIPYYRQEQDAIDFVQQMIAEELRKFEGRQRLAQVQSPEEERFVLNSLFPQYRHSCDYPNLCNYSLVCFDPGYAEDPVRTGMYRYRTPHHKAEKDALVNIVLK